MKYPILCRIIAAVVLAGVVSQASAQPRNCGTYDVQAASTVAEAVAGIRAVLECQGFTINAVINHGAAAESVGLSLRPTQLILFSHPWSDSLQMRWNRTAGIDLPPKLLVYEDAAGKVQVHRNASSYIADRHDVLIRNFPASNRADVLNQFDSDRGLVTVESKEGADAMVAALRAAIQAAGFNSLLIDHAAASANRYWPLPPTQLIVFGNPRVGTLLMQNEQTIGIDLPLKILVWQESRGERVFMTYNDPLYIARRHNVDGADAVLTGIANTLKNLTGALAKPAATE